MSDNQDMIDTASDALIDQVGCDAGVHDGVVQDIVEHDTYRTISLRFPTIEQMDQYASEVDHAGVEYAKAGAGVRTLYVYADK